MGQETEDKGLIKPYLLGEGDAGERERLEKRMMTDDGFFEELLVAEDELVDAYVASTLTAREREQFTNNFLSTPERHQKLRFAVALRKYVADAATSPSTAPDKESPKPSFWRRLLPTFLSVRHPAWSFGLAAALLLMVFGGVLLNGVWQNGRQSGGDESRPPFLVVALAPGMVRDAGEIKRVVVPAGVNTVQLRLEAPEGTYTSYRAALVGDGGREIFTREQLRPDPAATTKTIVVNLPAPLLKRGDYQLKLGGLTTGGEYENAGRYSFRVAGE